jgi:hypothetical protein
VQAHNPYRHPLSIHPSSRTDDEWTISNRPEPRGEDWVLILNDASRAFPTTPK